jgi:hypothetical protein
MQKECGDCTLSHVSKQSDVYYGLVDVNTASGDNKLWSMLL